MDTVKRQARTDGRRADELRAVSIKKDFLKFSEGSVLIEMGDTRVICAASVDERVPPFLAGTGKGWMTAEYSMLPGSSRKRIPRESTAGKVGGRTHEIQRLIGRSLRAAFDLTQIGERTVFIDCDVIQADGGTRTASITGAFIAVYDALSSLVKNGLIPAVPLVDTVAAISVGIVKGENCLDLNYEEDSGADVDMNVVMTGSGMFIEVQGTAEKGAFSREQMSGLMALSEKGITELTRLQKLSLALP